MKRWSKKEVSTLKKTMKAAANNKEGYAEVAKELGRTEAAVSTKWSLMQNQPRTTLKEKKGTSSYKRQVHQTTVSDKIVSGVRVVVTKTIYAP